MYSSAHSTAERRIASTRSYILFPHFYTWKIFFNFSLIFHKKDLSKFPHFSQVGCFSQLFPFWTIFPNFIRFSPGFLSKFPQLRKLCLLTFQNAWMNRLRSALEYSQTDRANTDERLDVGTISPPMKALLNKSGTCGERDEARPRFIHRVFEYVVLDFQYPSLVF